MISSCYDPLGVHNHIPAGVVVASVEDPGSEHVGTDSKDGFCFLLCFALFVIIADFL